MQTFSVCIQQRSDVDREVGFEGQQWYPPAPARIAKKSRRTRVFAERFAVASSRMSHKTPSWADMDDEEMEFPPLDGAFAAPPPLEFNASSPSSGVGSTGAKAPARTPSAGAARTPSSSRAPAQSPIAPRAVPPSMAPPSSSSGGGRTPYKPPTSTPTAGRSFSDAHPPVKVRRINLCGNQLTHFQSPAFVFVLVLVHCRRRRLGRRVQRLRRRRPPRRLAPALVAE